MRFRNQYRGTYDIEITVSDGKITLQQLQLLYDSLFDDIRLKYNSYSSNEKKLIVSNISVDEMIPDGDYTPSIHLDYLVGVEYYENNYNPFPETDRWATGGRMGLCDVQGDQFEGELDAAELIQNRINAHLNCQTNSLLWFTDIHIVGYGGAESEFVDEYNEPVTLTEHILLHLGHMIQYPSIFSETDTHFRGVENPMKTFIGA